MKVKGNNKVITGFIFMGLLLLSMAMISQIKPPIKKDLRTILLPDLTVEMIKRRTLKERPVFMGEQVIIKNIGKGPAANFKVRLVLTTHRQRDKDMKSNKLQRRTESWILKETRISSLKAGHSSTVNFGRLAVPANVASGSYFLAAAIDPENRVRETREDNNRVYRIFPILAHIEKVWGIDLGESYGGMLWSTVGIRGTHFGSTRGERNIRIGPYTVSTPSQWSDTYIQADLGTRWEPGNHQIYLQIGNRRVSNTKTYLLRSWIFYFHPGSGAAPGTAIRITGRNFGAVQGTKKLKFGTTEVNILSWSAQEIRGTVPGLSPGVYDVTIVKGNITVSSGDSYRVL